MRKRIGEDLWKLETLNTTRMEEDTRKEVPKSGKSRKSEEIWDRRAWKDQCVGIGEALLLFRERMLR